MKTLQRFLVLIATVVTLTATAAEARAEFIPASCNASAVARSAYRTGVRAGENLVQSSWNRISNCDQIEYFLSVVEHNVSRLTLPYNPSLSTVCRYTGTVDGVFNKMDALYGTCADQCFLEGEFAGEVSAEVYCELSIALGGLDTADNFLRGPVQVCGFNFEVACDASFIGTTMSYSNFDGVCIDYTEGEFEAVWDQARNNQCAYDPDPEATP